MRRIILLVLTAIVLVCAYFFIHFSKLSNEQNVKDNTTDTQEVETVNLPGGGKVFVTENIDKDRLVPKNIPTANDPSQLEELRELAKTNPYEAGKQYIAALSYVPINFHGKLLDQYENPIVGAKINLRVAQQVSGGSYFNVPVSLETDSNGRFHLDGISGEYFVIQKIEKEGYKFILIGEIGHSPEGKSKMDTSLAYPFVYRGWKIDTLDKVDDIYGIHINNKNILPNNQMYTTSFSDANGKTQFREGSGSDIDFKLSRVGNRFDHDSYQFELSIPSGGFIERIDHFNNTYPFMAPADGYGATISNVAKVTEDKKKLPRFEKKYYIKFKSEDGEFKYGYVKILINPFWRDEGASVSIRGYVNSIGERNLFSKINLRGTSLDSSKK